MIWQCGGAALAALAVAVLVSSCAAAPDRALPEGVTAQLLQYRSDVATRQVEVEIANGTDAPLEIASLSVSDARLVEPAVRVVERTSTVAARVTVAIRVQLPQVACFDSGGAAGADAAPAPIATVHWRQGTASGIAEVPLTDPLDVIAPLHERECRAQGLAEAAAVSFTSFTPSPPGQPAILTIGVVPTGKASATIVSIRPTNLLMVGTEARPDPLAYDLDLQIEPSSAPTEVELPLLPFRCDAHAVQEDKRGTIFGVDIRTAAVEGGIEIAASPEMRAAILTWVGQWCGFGS